MRTFVLLVAALLLAGCRSEKTPSAPTGSIESGGLPNPVTDPIVTGERLRQDMQLQNEQAKARRGQIDEMFEKK
jgi:hypothetical protein